MPARPARADGPVAPARVARTALRIVAALALMAIVVLLVGPQRLRGQLDHVDAGWFAAAVCLAAASQGVSVFRWEQIARIFGLRVRWRALSLAYAQGMTLNVVLPGATLGGDALRSLRLHQLGNPLGVSALTVLLDRLSGLWILCVLSLLTAIGLLAGWADLVDSIGAPAREGWERLASDPAWIACYVAGLILACALPWLPFGPKSMPSTNVPHPGARALWRRVWNRAAELHQLALAQRTPLLRSLWSSLLVQVLCAFTLWACAMAVGVRVAYWQVQAVAAPIFIAGALPVSYGGFGAREFAALIAFPLVGLPGDLGVAASALYGAAAIVLGLLAAPSFALARGEPDPGAGT